MPDKDSNHFVYKYVYKDEIIYIGKTDGRLERRLYQHGRHGDNISPEHFKELRDSTIYFCRTANNTMSDVIESELIRRYKPKLNKAKKSNWSGLNFPEPQWEKFVLNANAYITHKKHNNALHTKQKQAIEAAIQNLSNAKTRYQFLIDSANTEEMKLPVKDESEINFYMEGIFFNITNHMFRGINPPIHGLYHSETNQYYVTYSVSRLKKWFLSDLCEYESELNEISKRLLNKKEETA